MNQALIYMHLRHDHRTVMHVVVVPSVRQACLRRISVGW